MFPSISIQRLATAIAILFVAAGVVLAQKRDPLPVPDIPGFRTLKCDFHLHTVFSDGDVWPTTRVQEAWRDGLDAISITDHDDYRPHSEDVQKDLSRPYVIAAPVARQLGLILIPGVEITRGDVHFNALFVTEPNLFAGTEMIAALRQAREQGAIVFWNHPHWRNVRGWPEAVDAAHKQGLFTGVELVNGSTFHADAYPFIESKKLAILSNSDYHQSAPGERRTRPITLVFATNADSESVREAMRAHRSAAWMGGEVWGSEEHLKALWKGAVKTLQSEIRLQGKQRQANLQIHNASALPFNLKVKNAPSWLSAKNVSLAAESIGSLSLSLQGGAPEEDSTAELQLEITNFHTAPGKNLVVSLPIKIVRVQ
jgi:3',5'-nucleoside bisphosphate phosphatase